MLTVLDPYKHANIVDEGDKLILIMYFCKLKIIK